MTMMSWRSTCRQHFHRCAPWAPRQQQWQPDSPLPTSSPSSSSRHRGKSPSPHFNNNKVCDSPLSHRVYEGTLATQSAEILADRSIWLEFAHFLVHHPTHKLKKGKACLEYLRRCLNQAKDRVGGAAHSEFFSVLADPNPRNWLKSCIRECEKEKFLENDAKGEAATSQATPIYSQQRCEMSKAFRQHRKDARIAAKLNLVILDLVNSAAAGRPVEVASLSPDVMVWDTNGGPEVSAASPWPRGNCRLSLILFCG